MPKNVTVIVEMGEEKAYRLLFAELSNWIKRKSANAECTGKTGKPGSFEISIGGKTVFSKLERGGYPVMNEIAMAVDNFCGGKSLVEVTKIAKRKCKCGHVDCVCGVSASITKADCPCECKGECK